MNYGKVISSHKTANPSLPYVICLLAVSYILLYEWGLFDAETLATPVTVAKLLIPALLLVLIPMKRPQSRAFRLFILFYLLFMIWGIAPGLASGEFLDTGLVWLRYMPRFFFA